jgi:hypothetical protein
MQPLHHYWYAPILAFHFIYCISQISMDHFSFSFISLLFSRLPLAYRRHEVTSSALPHLLLALYSGLPAFVFPSLLFFNHRLSSVFMYACFHSFLVSYSCSLSFSFFACHIFLLGIYRLDYSFHVLMCHPLLSLSFLVLLFPCQKAYPGFFFLSAFWPLPFLSFSFLGYSGFLLLFFLSLCLSYQLYVSNIRVPILLDIRECSLKL